MDKTTLENKISELRKAYWSGECSTPDSEYDRLVEALRSIDPENKLLTTPECVVSIAEGEPVLHLSPMLSLQKVYSKEELMAWIGSVSRSEDEGFIVQPKYDGISCHCNHGTYSTRGDGHVGENVTKPMLTIGEMDGCQNTDDFYGEILIKKSDFNGIYRSIRKEDGEPFKNPRNAVAGILKNFSFYEKQGAKLTLVDYDRFAFSMKKSESDTKWDLIKSIIESLDYPMDGIVVKIADKDWRDKQGFTSHHPKGAMAFKFENVSAKTFLKSINWGMGKEYITATAVFESVDLNGVTVSRASIPMKSKTLPCVMNGDFNVGAIIDVERAGDVIPHIVSVSRNPTGETITINKCPFCGSEIQVEDSFVKCLNTNCKQKKIHRIYDALVQLGIKNIGEQMVSKICENLISEEDTNIAGFLDAVNNGWSNIACIEGFGNVSAKNVHDEVEKILDTTLAKFIAALGIPNVGTKIGNEIEKRFGSVHEFIEKATHESLSTLSGVGNKMSKRIMNWLSNPSNRSYLLDLESVFRFESKSVDLGDLPGVKTVCFTGAMRMARSEIQRLAADAGYSIEDAVTKNLDILVVADDVEMTSSKCLKAKKYGTEIVRENDFLARIS